MIQEYANDNLVSMCNGCTLFKKGFLHVSLTSLFILAAGHDFISTVAVHPGRVHKRYVFF